MLVYGGKANLIIEIKGICQNCHVKEHGNHYRSDPVRVQSTPFKKKGALLAHSAFNKHPNFVHISLTITLSDVSSVYNILFPPLSPVNLTPLLGHDPQKRFSSWQPRVRWLPQSQILLWVIREGSPRALQSSECHELLNPTRTSCLILAQRQPGKLLLVKNAIWRPQCCLVKQTLFLSSSEISTL